jgi:hypothetical protein
MSDEPGSVVVIYLYDLWLLMYVDFGAGSLNCLLVMLS